MTNAVEELRTLKGQEPFVPFIIIFKDGRRIEITRRLQYAFSDHRVSVLDEQDHVDAFRPSDIAEIQLRHPVS